MNEQDNYFFTEEIIRNTKAFALRLEAFEQVVIINADQEEAQLLNRIVSEAFEGVVTLTAEDGLLGSYEEYQQGQKEKTLFVLLKNRNSDIDLVEKQLHFFSQYLKNKHNRLLYVSESYIDDFKWERYFEVSEEEYAVMMEGQPEGCAAKRDFALDRYCAALFEQGASITVLRYNNLFGPSICSTGGDATAICRRAAETNEISFYASDRCFTRSYTYIGDLLMAINRLANGHADKRRMYYAYYLGSFAATPYQIKMALSAVLPKATLRYPDSIAPAAEEFSILQRGKINLFLPKARRTLEAAVEQTCYSCMDNQVFDAAFREEYNKRTGGKIDIVRQLEVDVLREIDRICKKHDIPYFVVGGCLLGAIRHGGFIPWDDDIDVSMLREDYERFRKIAPQELDERFYYQSYKHRDGSHNVFDKIRVNDTLFTTPWTSANYRQDVHDGVFVDIFVYDKTSNRSFIQNLHVKLVLILKFATVRKWSDRINRKNHYYLSLLLMPIIRLLPFGLFHFAFECAAKLFRRSRKSKYLIDSVGLNVIKVGAFPLAWYQDLTTATFEGMEVPITSAYDACLKRWYGQNYMEWLPPSKRAGHKIADLSVGHYMHHPE